MWLTRFVGLVVALYAVSVPGRAQVQLGDVAQKLVERAKLNPVCEGRPLVILSARVLIDRRHFSDDMAPQEYMDSVRATKAVIDQISQLAEGVGWQEYSDLMVKQWNVVNKFFASSSSIATRASLKTELARLDGQRQRLERQAIKVADAQNCKRPNPMISVQVRSLLHEIEGRAKTYVEKHPVEVRLRS